MQKKEMTMQDKPVALGGIGSGERRGEVGRESEHQRLLLADQGKE
jgi:hypothetical protein